MRYLTFVRSREDQGEPPPALFDAIAKYGIDEMSKGRLISTGGLTPSSQGARVRVEGGKITVTDGPFAEAKEVIGGFAMFEVSSRDEILEIARRFMELHREHWPEWNGECEVREAFTPPEFAG